MEGGKKLISPPSSPCARSPTSQRSSPGWPMFLAFASWKLSRWMDRVNTSAHQLTSESSKAHSFSPINPSHTLTSLLLPNPPSLLLPSLLHSITTLQFGSFQTILVGTSIRSCLCVFPFTQFCFISLLPPPSPSPNLPPSLPPPSLSSLWATSTAVL